MRSKYLLLLAVMAGWVIPRGMATETTPDPGKPVPVIHSPGYYYILTKSATRAQLQNRAAAARAEAARRAKAATNAAQPQTFVPDPPPSPPTPAPAPLARSGFVPQPSANLSQLRVVAAPAGRTNATKARPGNARPSRAEAGRAQGDRAEEATPQEQKAPPIVEASGPEYNDRDPLLAYQVDQAGKGNPESEYAVGIRYLTGNGVPQDDKLGREWLEKSSTHGNLRARAKLRELRNENAF